MRMSDDPAPSQAAYKVRPRKHFCGQHPSPSHDTHTHAKSETEEAHGVGARKRKPLCGWDLGLHMKESNTPECLGSPLLR